MLLKKGGERNRLPKAGAVADLGESGLGGAEGHIDGRCFARCLVAEPEGATDMAGAPTHGKAWGTALGVEKMPQGDFFVYSYVYTAPWPLQGPGV